MHFFCLYVQGPGDTWNHWENQCWQGCDTEGRTNVCGGFTSWTVSPTMKRIHWRDSWEVLNFRIPNLSAFNCDISQLQASSSSWVFSDPPEKENFDVCEPLLAWWPLAKDLVTHHLLQQPCCHFFGLRLCRDDDAAEWPWTSTRLVLQLGIAFRWDG